MEARGQALEAGPEETRPGPEAGGDCGAQGLLWGALPGARTGGRNSGEQECKLGPLDNNMQLVLMHNLGAHQYYLTKFV